MGEIYTVGRRLDVLTKWRIGLAGSFWPPAMLQASSALQAFPLRQRMLAWAAPVGRTAFTNYLGQSLILGWIFYGYGFGLFGKLSV